MFKHASGEIWNGDCLELMRLIPDGSVDMVLCDLPYGTTQNKWDSVIPFEPLWREYWRIVKPNAAIVLTASQPFTTALIASQMNTFKYVWTWDKKRVTGGQNASHQPMRAVEDICIFYNSKPVYNPQMIELTSDEIKRMRKHDSVVPITSSMRKGVNISKGYTEGKKKFPSNIIRINALAANCSERIGHPTQKPVALFEYLIKTYTNEGETVLDNTSGSGTTAVAAHRTGRRSICIERDLGYYLGSCGRIWKEQQA